MRSPVAVVLPTRDRPEMLARCLESLRAALGPDDELVVVDSASVTPIAGVGARVLRCDRPGVDRARNAGWRATTADLVLFVDDDVVVDAGWADAMAGAFARHPEAAFVTGRIDVPDDQAGTDRPVAIKDDDEPAVLDVRTEGTIGHSASLGVRRSALEQLGGFDESLGAGARFCSAPEVDLFDRLFAAGATGWYEPACRAWHDQWRGRRDKVRLDWRYGVGSGARIVKLLRTDRRRASAIGRDLLWDRGVRGAVIDLRNHYELGAATKLARVAGTLAGVAAASVVPVRDGHFAPRSER
ncbi:MAG: glycosyl transferase family 2 [Actinomycetia bacterium]|nr:glycosyl transferase family 2 [Actinomycetes bacterium]